MGSVGYIYSEQVIRFIFMTCMQKSLIQFASYFVKIYKCYRKGGLYDGKEQGSFFNVVFVVFIDFSGTGGGNGRSGRIG